MDFNWFFRRGPNDSQNSDFLSDKNDEFFGEAKKDEDFKSFGAPFDNFESMEGTAFGMFKHMDDMMSQMFSSFTPFGSIRMEDSIPQDNDPRSLMLKEPDSSKSQQYPVVKPFGAVDSNDFIDNDIDDEVAKHGLILDENIPKYNKPQTFSCKKFSSIRTIHSSDGTVEEHRTMSDSEGNVTTTIRRTIGDQCHEVTTHSDNKGVKETQENMLNLDENELSVFEKRWQNLKVKTGQFQEPDAQSIVPKFSPSAGDPTYLSLFKKFFGF